MNTIIERLNGKVYDLEALNIFTRDIIVSSPTPKTTYESMEGQHGAIDMGTVYGPRELRGIFYIEAYDLADYPLMRDEVYALFDSQEPFYLIEVRNGEGKRWRVKVAEPYELDQQLKYGFFEVMFTSTSPFAESVGTSLTPQTFDEEVWQFGQGLLPEDVSYAHNTSSFEIYNPGNQTVNPRNPNMEMLVTIKAVASSYFEIHNKTTGDVYRYNGKLTASDILRLDGIRSTKNSLSVFRDTNRKLLTLAPGFNEFEVKGVSSIESIEFDFRHYYL